MAADFGLDFGTTNSVAAFVGRDPETGGDRTFVLLNRDDNRPHPSVVLYQGSQSIVGRAAKNQLGDLGLGVFGDTVRSPKMYLGAPGVYVGGAMKAAKDVVGDILRFIRSDAVDRRFPNRKFNSAVMTIPVPMLGRARAELREAAIGAGFNIYQFVHEPLAALYGFLRNQQDVQREIAHLERRFMLVFDWGGGTLDITLCQLLSGALVQVLNAGDIGVGGDAFDLRLVQFIKTRHEAKHSAVDWTRMQPTAPGRLIEACEDAKIRLSSKESHTVYIRDAIASSGPEKDIEVEVTRLELQEIARDLVRRGLGKVHDLLTTVGLPLNAIEMCLATGGMVSMPLIREGLIELFGAGRLRVPENAATLVAEGSAWIAHDQVEVRLAKPFEYLHADDQYAAIINSGTPLPKGDKQFETKFSLYCVDPRDGHAKLQFARPRWPGLESPAEPRIPYTHMSVKVDPYSKPLYEVINIRLSIDNNMVVSVRAESNLRKDSQETHVHDLEFGLGLTPRSLSQTHQIEGDSKLSPNWGDASKAMPLGAVRTRSNVTRDSKAWALVPGDIIERYIPDLAREWLNERQRQEKFYYVPCATCKRTIYEITRDGCDQCAGTWGTKSRAEAFERSEERRRRGLPI